MIRLTQTSLFVVLAISLLPKSMLCQREALPWAPAKYNFLSSAQSRNWQGTIRSLRLADMQIVLEETTLEQVRNRFNGEIGRRGDAGDSEGWLCYQVSNVEGSWILWLTSDEIHGVSHISDFQWKLLRPNQIPDKRCKQLTDDSNKIELALPIRVGEAREEVLRALGKPTALKENNYYYMREYPATFHNEACTVWNGLTVEFREGIAAAIEAGLLSSC